MNFLVVSITLIYAACTFLGIVMDKDTPFATTYLTQALSANETAVMYVDNVTQFKNSPVVLDYVWINDEYIGYTAKTDAPSPRFTGLSRGVSYGSKATEAADYAVNRTVYSEEMSDLNVMIGYKIIQADTSLGKAWGLVETVWAWVRTIPRFVGWDYPFIPQIAKPFLYAVSIGFIVVFAMYVKKLFNPFSS